MEQLHRRRLDEAGAGGALGVEVLRPGHDLEEGPGDVRAAGLHPSDQRPRLGRRRLAVQQVLRETPDEPGLDLGRPQDAPKRALAGQAPLLDPSVESGPERGGERLPGEEGRHFAEDNGRRNLLGRSVGLCGRGGEAARHHRPRFESEDLRPEPLPAAPRRRPRSLRVRVHRSSLGEDQVSGTVFAHVG